MCCIYQSAIKCKNINSIKNHLRSSCTLLFGKFELFYASACGSSPTPSAHPGAVIPEAWTPPSQKPSLGCPGPSQRGASSPVSLLAPGAVPAQVFWAKSWSKPLADKEDIHIHQAAHHNNYFQFIKFLLCTRHYPRSFTCALSLLAFFHPLVHLWAKECTLNNSFYFIVVRTLYLIFTF